MRAEQSVLLCVDMTAACQLDPLLPFKYRLEPPGELLFPYLLHNSMANQTLMWMLPHEAGLVISLTWQGK